MILAAAALTTTFLALPAPPATAAPAGDATLSDYKVTYVVRACDSYAAILANKARNNIQESLRDLGPDFDSPGAYPDTNAAISAQVEDNAPSQVAGCVPFAEPWRFTMGTGLVTAKPETLYLSTVSGPDGTNIVSDPTTPIPELDAQGNPTGRTLTSAVTVPLTHQQAQQMQTGSRAFWLQGGTPSQPLNGREQDYGFAALRCGVDALNGDNIEQLAWPYGTSHIFCYSFLVNPPPAQGTITVTKQLPPGTPGSANFLFEGDDDSSNISYADTDGNGVNDFHLDGVRDGQPKSQTFVRGETRAAEGDLPWTFEEVAQEGWLPTGPPVCTSANGTSTFAIAGAHVAVTLGPNDDVACTYTNQLDLPATGGLYKRTYGGLGAFPFSITGPANLDTTPTTTVQGSAVSFATSAQLTAGDYTITETIPSAGHAGAWELTSVLCQQDGGDVVDRTGDVVVSGAQRTVTVTVPPAVDIRCLFTDSFTPTTGSLRLAKVTSNGAPFRAAFGNPAFSVEVIPFTADGTRFIGTEFEASVGIPSDGTPVSGFGTNVFGSSPPDTSAGMVTGPLANPAFYVVREIVPVGLLQGRWRPTGVACQDADTGATVPHVVVDANQNAIAVPLTFATPNVACTAENTWMQNSAILVAKATDANTALRPNPATLTLACDKDIDPDGNVGPAFEDTFEIAPGTASGSLAHIVPGGAVCAVSELVTGSAGTPVSTTVRVLDITSPDNPVELPELSANTSYTVPAGKVYAVEITNFFNPPLADTGTSLFRLGLAMTAIGMLLVVATMHLRVADRRGRHPGFG